jgi:acetyltransferase-like isoleucine patch superfamily enzyme
MQFMQMPNVFLGTIMLKYKIKRVIAGFISVVPLSALRIFLYRLCGYKFGAGCKIGLGVMIAVDQFSAGDNCCIRKSTTFIGPISVFIGNNVMIGRKNTFECGESAAYPGVAHMGYERELIIHDNALINEGHIFDLLGKIEVGSGTWVAGFSSQFLTHGAGVMDRNISIGSNCFLGSAVRFTPGSYIANDNIVALGAVVTKKFFENSSIIGGVPARVLRKRDGNDAYSFKKTW